MIKGLGPSTVSELLSYSNPNEYVIFNKTSIKCFEYLSIKNLPLYNYQFTGEKYIELLYIVNILNENAFIFFRFLSDYGCNFGCALFKKLILNKQRCTNYH